MKDSLYCLTSLYRFYPSFHLDGEAVTGGNSDGGSDDTVAMDTPVLEGHGLITDPGARYFYPYLTLI